MIRLLILTLLISKNIFAQTPLPEPLTLDAALSLVDTSHPRLLMAQANKEEAMADVLVSESEYGIKASLKTELRFIDPIEEAINRNNNDSRVSLSIRKKITDFGQLQAKVQSKSLLQNKAELTYLDAVQKQKLKVMSSFFNVVLSDLSYGLDNELVSVVFFKAYKARDQFELGRISEIELLEAESNYQKARLRRHRSDLSQQVSRTALAISLNRPGKLSENVLIPDFPKMEDTPSLDNILSDVLSQNHILKGLEASVASAEQALIASRKFGNPSLYAELESKKTNRPSASAHPLSASVIFEWPLSTGGERDALVAKAVSKLHYNRAVLALEQLNLKQRTLDLWTEMDTQRVALEALAVNSDYRNLYLERSRARFELELIADIGDAMAQSTIVSFEQVQARFKWMLAKQELIYLGAKMVSNEGATNE